MTAPQDRAESIERAVRAALDLASLTPPPGVIRSTFQSFEKTFTLRSGASGEQLSVVAILGAYGHVDRTLVAVEALAEVDRDGWDLTYRNIASAIDTAACFGLRAGRPIPKRVEQSIAEQTPQPGLMNGSTLRRPFEDEELLSQPMDMTKSLFGSAVGDIATLSTMWLHSGPKKLFGPRWHRVRIEEQLDMTITGLHALKGCHPGW